MAGMMIRYARGTPPTAVTKMSPARLSTLKIGACVPNAVREIKLRIPLAGFKRNSQAKAFTRMGIVSPRIGRALKNRFAGRSVLATIQQYIVAKITAKTALEIAYSREVVTSPR